MGIRLWLVVGVGVMMAFAPVQAAESAWAAWLYESTSGRVIQVDSAGGVLADFVLRADPGSVYSREIAISADGVYVAYSAAGFAGVFLNIFDLTTNAVMYSYRLPDNAVTSLEFSGSPFNYANGNSTFAFGYAAGDEAWRLLSVEMETYQATILAEGDPPMSSFEASSGQVLPLVMHNRGGNIAFMMIPPGTDGMAHYDGYLWNVENGTVTPSDTYITPDSDTLGLTDESVSAVADERFPESQDPDSGYPGNNTLQVFEPALLGRFTLAHLPRITNPTFIQGGEQIAVVHYDRNEGEQTLEVQMVDRSGTLVGTLAVEPANHVTSMIGTLNGFLMTASGDETGTRLYAVDTRTDGGATEPALVWENHEMNALLVWISDSRVASGEPFTEWGRIEPSGA
ncbi:MAG: hypothetical protein LCI00_10325 [Chloroflexi bacterium]|nr:hypothetical protein [Chloroflexota bacterium]MCC6894850.1 hypothetical protein [Anaerolineae bacterium]